MARKHFDPRRRIPNDVDTSDFIKGYSWHDLAVLIPAIFMFMFTSYLFPDSLKMYGLIMTVLVALAGVLGAIRTPGHITPFEWFSVRMRYLLYDSEMLHIKYHTSEEREQRDLPDSPAYKVTDNTQVKTHVEKIHKGHECIERVDGAMVALLKVDNTNLVLKSEDAWESVISDYANFLNNELNFELSIYSTNRPFDVETYLRQYRVGLQKPEVRNDKYVGVLMESFINWYEQIIKQNGINYREMYVIVEVKPSEIREIVSEESRTSTKVSNIPVLSTLIEKFKNRNSDMEEWEVQERLLKEVNRRAEKVDKECFGRIDGCSSKRLSSDKHSIVLQEYWEGQVIEYGEAEKLVREKPIMTSSNSGRSKPNPKPTGG